jgi:thiol-disulfide isomerase/thioredoxin
MDPWIVAGIFAGLVIVASVIGLVARLRAGRVQEVRGFRLVHSVELATKEPFGSAATFVQFSTELCSRCPATKALLIRVAQEHSGVRHIEVDISHRPDIASSFNILQTPTTLVLDNSGAIAARIGGAPRPEAVRTALDIALRRDHGNYVI